ncbi:RNA pseudouridine synthase 4, mitochondrial [Sesamum angolense]|uniref:RNA pseudouridine synthase 4, mitochondrial n=1 Tax=Sesamum angolense TaxID=2727404 RepID=A0AAE1X5G6_9LAMI|nr:RNA pseudouridine synthase 4, mitochondrial [Sesamum angolense]
MFRLWRHNAAASSVRGILTKTVCEQQYYCATAAATNGENCEKGKNDSRWLILPPFDPAVDGSSIGKKLCGGPTDSSMTALKWIIKCCPHLPRSLVQKLFRLRQVRKECSNIETKEQRPRRIGAKDLMDIGDRIFLPKSVDGKSPSATAASQSFSDAEELKLVQSLELYKDPAIIVINKPPGMPVQVQVDVHCFLCDCRKCVLILYKVLFQGGIGIKRSLDELAAKYLKYDYTESPRLVHRLDRDSSGILVMGRTQLTTTILHSIFREKTFGASDDVPDRKRILQKRYWALVIGSPRRREGLISVPLGKVVVDNGKSERITVVDNTNTLSAQHAVTEYRVIVSSPCGYTWLELLPLTGRKHQVWILIMNDSCCINCTFSFNHYVTQANKDIETGSLPSPLIVEQLRVHCAEVLGTPIVGDYKYGWQAHKKLGSRLGYASELRWHNKISEVQHDMVDFNSEIGSVSDKQVRLHLHCKEMILPNISLALQHGNGISDVDAAPTESIRLVAPLPAHMQRSWDLLN